MTTTSAICGHDRETLQWALRHWERCGGLSGFDAVRRGDAYCDAWRAIQDPKKLAAIIGDTLAVFRFCVVKNGDDPGDDLFFPAVEVFADGDSIGMHLYKTWSDCQGEPRLNALAMFQARALALRLLDATTATALNIERIIGEVCNRQNPT